MKRNRMMLAAAMVAALFLLTMGAPVASADIITIGACNGCGVAGPYGTVTLTQNGSDVDVVIQANSGFSWKTADGSDIYFNPTVTLTAASFKDATGAAGAVSSNTPDMNGLTFGFKTDQNVDSLGTFAVDLTGIGTTQVGSVQSVGSWEFTIVGVSVAELVGENTAGVSWGVHTCAAGPSSCDPVTFFAGSGGPPPVPDGGVTLMMLGSALVGLDALRRRFRA